MAPGRRCALEHGANILHACSDGTELHKRCVGMLCYEACECGLAGAGRTPENQRGNAVALDQNTERLPVTEEVVLPDKLVQRAGTNALCQRNILLCTRGVCVSREQIHQRVGDVL